jgi:hypothetical protein
VAFTQQRQPRRQFHAAKGRQCVHNGAAEARGVEQIIGVLGSAARQEQRVPAPSQRKPPTQGAVPNQQQKVSHHSITPIRSSPNIKSNFKGSSTRTEEHWYRY